MHIIRVLQVAGAATLAVGDSVPGEPLTSSDWLYRDRFTHFRFPTACEMFTSVFLVERVYFTDLENRIQQTPSFILLYISDERVGKSTVLDPKPS